MASHSREGSARWPRGIFGQGRARYPLGNPAAAPVAEAWGPAPASREALLRELHSVQGARAHPLVGTQWEREAMGTPVSLREVGFGGGESPPEIPPHERGRPGGYGLPVQTPLPPSRLAPLSSRRIFAHAGVRANDVPLLGAVPEQPVWLLPASSWPRPANCQGRSTQSTAPRPPTRVVAVPLRRGLPLSKWDFAGRCRSAPLFPHRLRGGIVAPLG
jgi:hypothetical protein